MLGTFDGSKRIPSLASDACKALLSSHRLSLWSLSLPRSEANCLVAQTLMRRVPLESCRTLKQQRSNVQGDSYPGPASSHLPQNHWFCSAHLSHCFRPQPKAKRYGFSPRLQRVWLMHPQDCHLACTANCIATALPKGRKRRPCRQTLSSWLVYHHLIAS